MEILNNIWNALTTENEFLLKIISIPFNFIEVYISLLIFTSFLKINYTKKQKYLFILINGLMGIFSRIFIPDPFYTIFNYIFLFFVILFIFKLSVLKTIFALLIPFGTFAFVSTLILNPIIKLLHINTNLLKVIPLYRIFYLCILYTILSIIILFYHFKNSHIDMIETLNTHYKNIVYFNLFLGIFTLIIQLIIAVFYTNVLPIYITFLSSISLFLYFLISFYSLYHIIKLQKTTKDLENAETYNKTLSVLYDNVKAFKHDFENMVNMIGGYVKNNDIDGLREYYSGLEKDYAKIKNLSALNPTLINNSGIYNLLIKKYSKANSIGVKMDLEYFFDFERLHMPIYQFSRMLGILIDNAIEAAEASEEKHVLIRFRDSSFHHTQIIIIENSYCSKEKIDTKNIFKKGITGKDGHMGMGLWEVHEILMKNNNVNLITSTDENIFKQQIEIYY